MWRSGPRLPGRRGSVPGRNSLWGRKDPPLSSDRSCWSAGSCLGRGAQGWSLTWNSEAGTGRWTRGGRHARRGTDQL